MEGTGGKESASWQVVENDWKGTDCTRNVAVFSLEKSESEKVSRRCCEGKAGRDTSHWQQESPAREALEQVQKCAVTDGKDTMA